MRRLLSLLFALAFSLPCAPLFAATDSPQPPVHTFTAGNGTFLLDGQPFVIKAAEIHYPRIPAAYWEHRIQMCKALGMNTLCLYIFWNYHEQQPGVFDFSGDKDIAAFCRLAQKHGLYVIVRPGPYVCAEWEMGGLPWWLLKKPDIRLRSNDPDYLAAVKRFLAAVGKELAPLQLARGGNILMVQVENEFGAYAIDKPYVSTIRDYVKAAGFGDSLLFQCDWSSSFQLNGLDDLLWTLNFATGADIDTQFRALREARPNTPLMCSEFWSGWFDHWGRRHETRDAETMVRGIDDMLQRNISFSLYMTHGGTTFGWWGGANSPAYSAMCTSYDYDAPINEAGHATPKYHKLRELLARYSATPLPEIPAPPALAPIPPFTATRVASLFDTLPPPIESPHIQPMEAFDQGWGSILYSTTLPRDAAAGETLLIDELHDWGQLFADGILLARLDRRRNEFTYTLTRPLPAGTRLDILVEAMGRVNFGSAIHDRKGITRRVLLGQDELLNWRVYPLPATQTHAQLAKARPSATSPADGPAYWRATFTLATPADTFLDLSTWGKGLVWINGRPLGRFWEIGPQQTLYLPGCWLRQGANELLILDLKGPRAPRLQGLAEPILDCLADPSADRHRRPGQTLSLAGLTPCFEGTLTPGGTWQSLPFPECSGRYLALEVLSTMTDGPAAISELELLGPDGKSLPRDAWRILYASSEELLSGNHTADKVYDLQESTYWTTEAGTAAPHTFLLDLGQETPVAGIRLLSRPESGTPGQIKTFRLYLQSAPFAL